MRLSWFIWLILVSLVGAADGKIDVHLTPWATRSLATYKGHEQETLHEREARFVGMKPGFGIRYKAGLRDDRPGQAFPLEGYLGMPRPSACNWYHSGFLSVRVNGQDIGRTALASMTVSEVGDRGVVDLVWHAPAGAARVRFLALPDDDRLFCEIRIDAAEPDCRLRLDLRCYPSFFTSHHRRKGDRQVLTPTAEVRQGENRELALATDDWAFYQDLVFDPTRGEGEGPCAVLVGTAADAEIQHSPGSYAVETRVDFAPGTREARLVFWDFRGQGNASALEQLRATIPATREALARLDFSPANLRTADFATLRQEVTRAIDEAARVPAAKELVAQARAWLAALPPDSAQQNAERGVADEEALARWLDEYHAFRWRLRLAVLLSRI